LFVFISNFLNFYTGLINIKKKKSIPQKKHRNTLTISASKEKSHLEMNLRPKKIVEAATISVKDINSRKL